MIFILIFLGQLLSAEAQVLSTFVRSQTGTLPQGRFIVSYSRIQSSADSIFNRDGTKTTLTDFLNQNISFQDIAEDDPVRTQQLLGLFQAYGVNGSAKAGNVSGSILGQIRGDVPVLGYGLSDDIGLFLAVPILKFQFENEYVFARSPEMTQFLADLRNNGQTSVAAEFEAAMNNSLEYRLYRAGMKWESSLNRTYIGDLRLNLVKVLSLADQNFKLQIQPEVIIPTASDALVEDLFALRAGQKRWGLGVGSSLQWDVPDTRFSTFFTVSGTLLIPAKRTVRYSKAVDEELLELVDQNTTVAGGHQFMGKSQLRYTFPKWVAVNSGLQYQAQTQESFTTSTVDRELQKVLSSRSGYSLYTWYSSVDLNSVQSFLDGNFLFPAVAELGVGIPLAGRNAIAEPVYQAQMSMFF